MSRVNQERTELLTSSPELIAAAQDDLLSARQALDSGLVAKPRGVKHDIRRAQAQFVQVQKDLRALAAGNPTTVAGTAAPTTAAPTTAAGTTAAGTTVAGTTVAGTTAKPTTVAPTTAAGTTVAGTTAKPTTAAPTTAAGTTAAKAQGTDAGATGTAPASGGGSAGSSGSTSGGASSGGSAGGSASGNPTDSSTYKEAVKEQQTDRELNGGSSAGGSSTVSSGSSVAQGPPPSDPRDRSARNGVWQPDGSSPPYVHKYTMYGGEGADPGKGDWVRHLFGIKLSRAGNWDSDQYLESFESDQFRFLARNKKGYIIVPSLGGPVPDLSERAAALLKLFVTKGGNTLVVCGSPQNVIFLNSILPIIGYDGTLEDRLAEGLFEKQKVSMESRFKDAAIMLPGDNAVGLKVKNLPQEAISYYESPRMSGVVGFPAGSGKVVYLAYDFVNENKAWEEVLYAAADTTEEKLVQHLIEKATAQ